MPERHFRGKIPGRQKPVFRDGDATPFHKLISQLISLVFNQAKVHIGSVFICVQKTKFLFAVPSHL